MRSLLLLFVLLAIGTISLAQPVNNNCSGLIDLGVVPTCDPTIYTNVGATGSDIGFGNNPSCFNGGTAQRDVWFAFTATSDLTDVTITLVGVNNGPNIDPITNPQIALYRGDCETDGLAELSCISTPDGATQIQLDILGLTPDIPYYIRINDYSATAAPNWGDFTLCIEEYVPAINIGTSPSTTACFGTLYDSGGPDNDYGDNENATFVICPSDFHSCIELEMDNFQTEGGFDFINIYAGNDNTAPLITSISGVDNGLGFPIQATSQCVTVEFISDGSNVGEGFAMTWQCSPLGCSGNGVSNPAEINNIPFTQNGNSTCNGAAMFGEVPCNNANFIFGPQYVFSYDSPGNICASIVLSGAQGGTGILVLNGPPGDPNTVCIAQSDNGNINSANFEDAGTYYIVVANPQGCTNFNITLQEAECLLLPSLANALCNPLNGCVEEGVPSLFNFENGFQDIDVITAINGGCWLGAGFEPDFYWFTVEAQSAGPLGFIFQSPDPSDIDFNVWGPFTPEQVCENPGQVINFISNNQPIRSSWAAGADPTGLADIHPILGTPVDDAYDCGGAPGAGGDDFVSTIPAQAGEVYVVLVNDFGEGIATAGMLVDWTPSQNSVLFPPQPEVVAGDTAVCAGESVQIEVFSSVNSIEWVGLNTGSLSCTDCFTPIATPTATTTYKGLINAVCYTDTVQVTVQVFHVDAGPDRTVCRGEEIQLQAGEFFDDATYEWTVPAGLQFSCLDCPNPIVTAITAGVYVVPISLDAPGCFQEDQMTITVLPAEAPQFIVSDDQEICEGETVQLGGTATPGVNYVWTSVPIGFASTVANPSVSPSQTTTYYVAATNGTCPVPSLDSVHVQVFTLPIVSSVADTAVCQSSSIVLSNLTPEAGTTYLWTGPANIEDPTDPNTTASPEGPGTYTLVATRGICSVTTSVDVTITAISLDIQQPALINICQGTSVTLNANVVPAGSQAVWTPNNGSLNTSVGNTVIATPQSVTQYIARVDVPGCFKLDTVLIEVDSLPLNLAIIPSDTTVCQGSPVVLVSPIYQPSEFPEISFQWVPDLFSQSSDTLFNFVVQPLESINYSRITTNGACIDTSFANITVDIIPIATLLPADTTVCAGQPVQLAATFNVEVEEISWSPAEGLSCTDCPGPVGVFGATTQVTVTGDNGQCSGSATATITILQPPVINFTDERIICEGDGIQLAFGSDPSGTYSWTSTDPDFTPTNDPEPIVSPDQTATYTVVAQNGDCSTTQEITIEVVQNVTLEVTVSDDVVCQGLPVTLTATVSQSNSGESFAWTSANNGTFNGAVFTLTPESTDTYFLVYTSACDTLRDTVTITVLTAPVINLTDQLIICEGDNIQLASDADPSATYSWTSTDPDFTPTNDPEPIVSPDQTATYTVVAQIGDCSTTQSITIEVVQEVTLEVTASNDVICLGLPVTLTATASPGNSGETFAWTSANNGNSNNAVFTLTPGSTDTYFLEYTSANNCQTLRDTVTVTVVPNISVEIQILDTSAFDRLVPIGQEVNLEAVINNQGSGTPVITWSGGPYASTDGASAVAQPIDTNTVYIVQVTTPEGCTGTATVTINIEQPELDAPKAFTPNADMKNDVFRFLTSALVKEVVEFKIYNRWGQVVHDAKDNNGWDGNQKGKPAPSDVYIYNIIIKTFDDKELKKKGDVTLLR